MGSLSYGTDQMTRNKLEEILKDVSLEALIERVIWESVMEGTAWCGWTDRARDGLVREVYDSVKWAIDQKMKLDNQQREDKILAATHALEFYAQSDFAPENDVAVAALRKLK